MSEIVNDPALANSAVNGEITAPDQGHAQRSASGSERWELCPGSLAMEHGKPDDASEFADEGTAAHTLAALTLADPEHRAHEFLGRHIQVTDSQGKFRRGFVVDHEMADHVQKFVRDSLIAAGEGTLLVEQRVPLTQITDEPGATGQADVITISADGSEIGVRDLKYGMGVKVFARHWPGFPPINDFNALREIPKRNAGKLNSQLVMYASGALERFDGLTGKATHVRLTIQQPRLDHTDEALVTIAELQARVVELRKAADLAMTAFTFREGWMHKSVEALDYLVPGETQCRFCKAKATCPKLAEHVKQTIGADFAPIDGTQDHNMPAIVATEPLDTLTQKMLAVDLVEDWCRAVRAETERRLGNGIAVPEFKLVQGKRGNRQWADEAEAEAALKAMRLKSDEMYVQKLQSPTQIEKVLKTSPRKWKKVAPLITQSDGKLHVAHISDPRPAVDVGQSADDFAPIETPVEPITQESDHADLT